MRVEGLHFAVFKAAFLVIMVLAPSFPSILLSLGSTSPTAFNVLFVLFLTVDLVAKRFSYDPNRAMFLSAFLLGLLSSSSSCLELAELPAAQQNVGIVVTAFSLFLWSVLLRVFWSLFKERGNEG